jgi:predicted TIM-barrel fold metal-dependent hydrolase
MPESGSNRAAFERARALIDHLSAADQAKILGGTAKTLFKFGG